MASVAQQLQLSEEYAAIEELVNRGLLARLGDRQRVTRNLSPRALVARVRHMLLPKASSPSSGLTVKCWTRSKMEAAWLSQLARSLAGGPEARKEMVAFAVELVKSYQLLHPVSMITSYVDVRLKAAGKVRARLSPCC